MEVSVDVPCLILDNLHYPIYQFNLSNNPPDVCKPPHWHAGRVVFPLESPLSGRSDPNSPECGFGRYRDIPQGIFRISAELWEEFLLAHIPPL